MCGAPDALMRFGARTFLLISLLLGSHNQYKVIKVRAPRCVSVSGAPSDVPNCHLDITTMDNSSMHPWLVSNGIEGAKKPKVMSKSSDFLFDVILVFWDMKFSNIYKYWLEKTNIAITNMVNISSHKFAICRYFQMCMENPEHCVPMPIFPFRDAPALFSVNLVAMNIESLICIHFNGTMST